LEKKTLKDDRDLILMSLMGKGEFVVIKSVSLKNPSFSVLSMKFA